MIKFKLTWIIVVLVVVFGFAACEKETAISDSPDLLLGCWVSPERSDSTITFTRADQLIEWDYGFCFLRGGKFLERKNAGWCGTPPITYGDFDGFWKSNDSSIEITVDFWGGEADFLWEIISIDETRLTIYIASENYRYMD